MRFCLKSLSAFLCQCISLISASSNGAKTVSTRVQGLATCRQLQSVLGSSIVVLSGPEYNAGVSSVRNVFNTESSPSCIVFPLNASHVQAAMKAIYQNKIRYAVQAGGHSAMKGWDTVQDGILISFSSMQNVTYDATRDTITLEPGVRWGNAISALESYGVAPLGGRISDIGTGLLLGGGFSFLAAQYGFSADMYKELDVVLVTGELVTATATNEYADLFRALKGGANRFGIVTRYEVHAVHTGTKDDKNWFGGFIFYPASSAEALANATAHYVQTVKDPKAALIVIFTYYINGTAILPFHAAALFYQGSSLPPAIFSSFLSIPSTSQSLAAQSYSSVASSLGTGSDTGQGYLFGASALSGPPENYINAFRHFTNLSMSILPLGKTFGGTMAFTPVLESQIQAGRRMGGNAIDPPLESYAAVQLQTQFMKGVNFSEVPDEVEQARLLFFEQVPRSPGFPLFMNECDKKQNVFETYGGYEFLKKTYMKYDPTRFNVEYTDGPIGL